MEADIVDGKLGEHGSYDVEFKGGKLVAKVDYSPAGGVKGGAFIELEAEAVKEAIKKAIPGQYDDVALDLLFSLLK